MKDGIPVCPECGGPMHLESSPYGRAWECDRRSGSDSPCAGIIQIQDDDELTELQIAELIAKHSPIGESGEQAQDEPRYRSLSSSLGEIAQSRYLSGRQRRVIAEAHAIVEHLANAAELATDGEKRQKKAGEAEREKRFQQALGLLGPSLAPDPNRLEASVIDLLALARFGDQGRLLAEDSAETLEARFQVQVSGEQTPLDRLFADLVSVHQEMRRGIAGEWSLSDEPIQSLHHKLTAAFPRLREDLLASPPVYLQVARRLIAETTSENVVPMAPRRFK